MLVVSNLNKTVTHNCKLYCFSRREGGVNVFPAGPTRRLQACQVAVVGRERPSHALQLLILSRQRFVHSPNQANGVGPHTTSRPLQRDKHLRKFQTVTVTVTTHGPQYRVNTGPLQV